MKRVGAHVSASGGVSNAILNALTINAKAFALFVKNQRQWFTKPFTIEEEEKFKSGVRENDLGYILPHASYLVNLGSPREEAREKSIKALAFEMKLCKRLGIDRLNVHPGSHLREISEAECLANISDSINILNREVPGVKVVLENTAGQGSNVGYDISHLKSIIDGVDDKDGVGICIDTCHAFAAGYDLLTLDSSKKFFDMVFDIIDLKYLSGLHLNDSKMGLGSRRDRHESLGSGFIGLELFKYIMNSEYFDNIPLILETPNDNLWAKEIEMLYNFIK